MIVLVADGIRADAFKETRPATLAGKLAVRTEQGIAAGRAVVGPDSGGIPVFPGEGPFRLFIPRDFIYTVRQHPLPFRIGYLQNRGICPGVIRVLRVMYRDPIRFRPIVFPLTGDQGKSSANDDQNE